MIMSVDERMRKARASRKLHSKKSGKASTRKPNSISTGEIESGKSYTLERFEQLTGLGADARRKAERNGLQTVLVGRAIHVLGDDWLAYLKKLAADKQKRK